MEPKWNVKVKVFYSILDAKTVLMEPKWNVKEICESDKGNIAVVLMEPKWNVKKPRKKIESVKSKY